MLERILVPPENWNLNDDRERGQSFGFHYSIVANSPAKPIQRANIGPGLAGGALGLLFAHSGQSLFIDALAEQMRGAIQIQPAFVRSTWTAVLSNPESRREQALSSPAFNLMNVQLA